MWNIESRSLMEHVAGTDAQTKSDSGAHCRGVLAPCIINTRREARRTTSGAVPTPMQRVILQESALQSSADTKSC